jgi:hypothetical protein
MLADLAVREPDSFKSIVEKLKNTWKLSIVLVFLLFLIIFNYMFYTNDDLYLI